MVSEGRCVTFVIDCLSLYYIEYQQLDFIIQFAGYIQMAITYLFLFMIILNVQFVLTDDCHWVTDHCPVWNGWSDPKCRVDDEVCQGNLCYKYACTYCAARAFGCFVDLQGGAPTTIDSIEPIQSFNCGDVQIKGSVRNQFTVHCGCTGYCNFHGYWKINYKKRTSNSSQTAEISQ